MHVIITSPSLTTTENVSGVSAVASFISRYNVACTYRHFTLGKKDNETRNVLWLLRNLASYAHWVYLLLSDKHAIIHFNLALDRRSLIRDSPLIMLARLFRRRVILHIHGGEFLAGEGMPSWSKAVMRLTLACGPIIVLSQMERAMLENRVRDARVFVLPNCIAPDEARVFERTYRAEEPLTMLFLGRITVNKGIDVIYRALQASRRKGTRFRFVMAGAGPEQGLYVERFRNLLGEDFDFRGVVAGAEKTEVLKTCNILLLPSFFEGMPMALLESMAFGLVPITTNVGSISTVVKHGTNGIIVHRQAPQEIVDAIDRLAADREYMHMLSRNSRQYVLRNCVPEAYFEQLNTIYELGSL